MLISEHSATHVKASKQKGTLPLEHGVSMQSPTAIRDRSADADMLFISLLAASPVHGALFALSMHERLCERGDFDHAAVWEAVLRLWAPLFNKP